jgi:hypothetical protein
MEFPHESKGFLFNRALKANPENSVVLYSLALTLEKLGEPDRAMRHHEIFLRGVPNEFDYLVPKAKKRVCVLKEKPL